MLRLNGATITRIREQLVKLNEKMGLKEPYDIHPVWCKDSYGTQHRAIEEFVEELWRIIPDRRGQ